MTDAGRSFVPGTRITDLSGQKFGAWTVLSFAGGGPTERRHSWNCLCECGTRRQVPGYRLLRGGSLSCGCRRRDGVEFRGSSFDSRPPVHQKGLYGQTMWEKAQIDRQVKRDVLREALAVYGMAWRDARAWGVASGGFMPADCPAGPPNAKVMARCLEWIESLVARLATAGKGWQDARLWGIEEGGFSPADCTPQYPNPAVMAGYLEWLEAGHE